VHDNTFLYPILNFGICYRNKTWKFELKPDPYYIKKDDARLNRDSYIFQKLVPWKSVLTLGDKGTFHYSEARQLIEAVSYFFSFVFGRYMEPNLFIGFKSERPIIEKWEIQRFPWPIYHIPTWFNRYEAACLEKILPRFINLWESNSNAMREILEYHFIVKNEKHFPPQIRLSLLYSLAELFFDIKLKGNNNENKPEQLLKTINWVGVGNRESQIDEACNLHGLIERLHDQVCSNVSKCLYNKHSDEFYPRFPPTHNEVGG